MAKLQLATHVNRFYGALVEDIEELMNMDKGTLSEDLERLQRTISSRGVQVVLLALPAICNDLERSLDIGWYKQRYTGELSSLDGFLPVLFRNLYLQIFSEGGVLLEDPSPLAVLCLRQLLRCFKKFDTPCPPDSTERAIDAFIRIEEELLPPSLSWGDRDLRINFGWPCLNDLVRRSYGGAEVRHRLREISPHWAERNLERLASYVQSVADSVIGKFMFDFSSIQPKHGPGSVSERFHTSKYEFPTWGHRLEKVFPYSEFGIVNYTYLGQEEPADFHNNESAKLIAVPKDYKGPRLIASEPICAQYMQQAILKDLRRNVKKSVLRHSIDFKSQVPSQLAALAASDNNGFATIDLSSASDRLSCAFVECVFRGKFSYMEVLNSARTHEVRIDKRGVKLECKKFAAQGAAFTFPVQSICYAIVAIGCLLASNPKMRLADAARKVRVFGDDIIIPEVVFDDVCQFLTACQLVVNHDKSFSTGFFRESCGMDAYRGTDVTPAYVRWLFQHRQPTATESTVESSNNLYLKGFIRASSVLLDFIPRDVRRDIPYVKVGSNVWGIVGPNSWARKKRFNRNLQRYEVRCLSVTEVIESRKPDGAERLLQWFNEKPSQDVIFDPYRKIRGRFRYCERWIDITLLG